MAAPDERVRASLASIVLNYNYSAFVADAIESLLRQDPPPDQVIVVDDGSTDDSLSVIHRFDGRITVVEKANGGQLSASIAGLAACTSEYVHFLDADDYVLDGFVAGFRQHSVHRPAKVQFQMSGVDAAGGPLGSVFPNYPAVYSTGRMRSDNRTVGFYICPPTSGNVYRADALRALGLEQFDPRESVDGPVALLLPYLGEVETVHSPLVGYRVHDRNVSQYGSPTPVLLQREIDIFLSRWAAVCQALGFAAPPFGSREPLFVTERRLMLAVLTRGGGIARCSLLYCRGLARSSVTTKQSLALAVWALLLIIPPARMRQQLVRLRRSSRARPRAVRWLVARTRRH